MCISVADLRHSSSMSSLPSSPADLSVAHRPPIHVCTVCSAGQPLHLPRSGFRYPYTSPACFSATYSCLIHMVHIAGSGKPHTRDPSSACQATDTVFTMPLLGGLGALPTQCASASPLSQRLSGINSCLITQKPYCISSVPRPATVPSGGAPSRLLRRQPCTVSAFKSTLPLASRP